MDSEIVFYRQYNTKIIARRHMFKQNKFHFCSIQRDFGRIEPTRKISFELILIVFASCFGLNDKMSQADN